MVEFDRSRYSRQSHNMSIYHAKNKSSRNQIIAIIIIIIIIMAIVYHQTVKTSFAFCPTSFLLLPKKKEGPGD